MEFLHTEWERAALSRQLLLSVQKGKHPPLEKSTPMKNVSTMLRFKRWGKRGKYKNKRILSKFWVCADPNGGRLEERHLFPAHDPDDEKQGHPCLFVFYYLFKMWPTSCLFIVLLDKLKGLYQRRRCLSLRVRLSLLFSTGYFQEFKCFLNRSFFVHCHPEPIFKKAKDHLSSKFVSLPVRSEAQSKL